VLLIDSPGAEEVVQQDIDQLLKGLGDLSADLPHLQSIIATTSSDSVYRYLPAEQVVYAVMKPSFGDDQTPVW